jgi:hypothetical protein
MKTLQNLWNATKGIFLEKCLILNAHIRKKEILNQ